METDPFSLAYLHSQFLASYFSYSFSGEWSSPVGTEKGRTSFFSHLYILFFLSLGTVVAAAGERAWLKK